MALSYYRLVFNTVLFAFFLTGENDPEIADVKEGAKSRNG
jgi:hypothetical protein